MLLAKSPDRSEEWPRVEIITVSYNNRRFVPDYLEGLRGLFYPRERFNVTIVDNASQDDSAYLFEKATDLPLRVIRNSSNEGFAKGNNVRLLSSSAEFIAILNPDTRVKPDWLGRLVEVMLRDPRVGLCEARQSPRPIDKYYDRLTYETSWCSGGGALFRRTAVQEIGGFDERFFMYGEDVDLSWRMWLAGWKCIYEPRAVYEHWTMEQDHSRDRSIEYYYCYRNGIFLRYIYAPHCLIVRHYLSLLWKGFVVRKDNNLARHMMRRALISHFRDLPHFISRRHQWRGRTHPWVQPRLWTYGWLASERSSDVRNNP